MKFGWFVALMLLAALAPCQPRPVEQEKQRAFRERQELLARTDIPQALKAAIIKGPHQRYRGRRTVEFLHGPENLRHEEIVFRQGPKTRVEFPQSGPYAGQIIVENRKERKHYFPGRNELDISPPRREENFQRLVRFVGTQDKRRFSVTAGPGATVAGVAADQVVVADAKGNVVQRLFIEPRSGVLLKRQIFDAGAAQVGFFEYTEIDLNPPPFDPSLFEFNRSGVTVVTPYDSMRRIAGQTNFDPVYLPPSSGYQLDETRTQQIRGDFVMLEVYRSPRGNLTLFQLRSSVSQDRLKKLARNETHVYTWQAGGKTFVLVGNLDEAALERLAHLTTNGTQ